MPGLPAGGEANRRGPAEISCGNAPLIWAGGMAETGATVVAVLVAVLLAAGIWRQFVPMGRIGQIFDAVGIVPQWRFYAQADIAQDMGYFDDPHLLARTAGPDGPPGDWIPAFWLEDRRLLDMAWNPRRRSSSQLIDFLLVLANRERGGNAKPVDRKAVITSIPYLSVLRHCLDRIPLPEGGRIQFAVATTSGRGERSPVLRFCSEWHEP